MKIVPKDGIQLRDPKTRTLVGPEGIEVADDDFFWVRRVRDGDAVVVEEQAQAAAEHEQPADQGSGS